MSGCSGSAGLPEEVSWPEYRGSWCQKARPPQIFRGGYRSECIKAIQTKPSYLSDRFCAKGIYNGHGFDLPGFRAGSKPC